MTVRDDMLKRLHTDDLFKSSLDKAKDEGERQAITGLVEGFVSAFADVMEGILAQASDDELLINNDTTGSRR